MNENTTLFVFRMYHSHVFMNPAQFTIVQTHNLPTPRLKDGFVCSVEDAEGLCQVPRNEFGHRVRATDRDSLVSRGAGPSEQRGGRMHTATPRGKCQGITATTLRFILQVWNSMDKAGNNMKGNEGDSAQGGPST